MVAPPWSMQSLLSLPFGVKLADAPVVATASLTTMFKVGTFLNTLAFPYNLFNVEILELR